MSCSCSHITYHGHLICRKDCGQDSKAYRNRQLYQWSDTETLLKTYLSVIRPHLEYAAPVWSPDLIKDVNNWNMCKSLHLECAQKSGVRCTRICLRSVMNQSSLLGGITLVSASYIKSLMENASYRMLLYLTYSTTYFTRSNVANRYVLPFAHTNLLQGSYFHRTISLWNSLPSSIMTTTSLPSFKRQFMHLR